MTQLSDRPILTLPAIQPCEYICPTTLLHALIALAHQINAYRSNHFMIHRRCAREALREVGVLLVFLEDIRDRQSHLPDSVVLSFSELHVTIQKLGHLLYDCARKGARLWVLMNSDRILSEYRILIRSIATALDVVPLDSVDADQETKEMVCLVSRQAWKVAIVADPADDRAVIAIRSILDQFRKGVTPDPSDLRRVLDHLWIRNWTDCNEEISFLEKEIFNGEDGEAALLGSLMGFMIYCRAVLFEVTANGTRSDWRKECQFQETGIHGLNPEGLRCPISLELMADPVTISTGQTYDQPSIARWLKAGYHTCPVTGQKLTNTEFVHNSTIQKLVRQYCHHNNIPIADPSGSNDRRRDLTKTLSPNSSSAAGATKMVATFLVNKLYTGTNEEKNRAAYEIRLLSKSSIFQRACLVEADSVPWLLHLLASSDPSTQDNAVAALLNLSKHPSGRTAIFEVGGLNLIVDVMAEGLKVEAQQNAAAILFYLSSVKEYRRVIGEIREAIPALVNLLTNGTYHGKKNAVVTLFGLILFPGNHSRILAAGAIPALTNLVTDEREDLVTDCVGVLAKIAERKEGTNAMLKSSSEVLPLLVELLHSSTSRLGREYCVSALLSLCNNGGPKVIGLLEKFPLLMPSLYSLITGGTPHASKKARTLINHIHRIYDDQGYPAAASTLPVQHRVVHVL